MPLRRFHGGAGIKVLVEARRGTRGAARIFNHHEDTPVWDVIAVKFSDGVRYYSRKGAEIRLMGIEQNAALVVPTIRPPPLTPDWLQDPPKAASSIRPGDIAPPEALQKLWENYRGD